MMTLHARLIYSVLWAAIANLSLAFQVSAQLTPARTYYPVGGRIEVSASVPEPWADAPPGTNAASPDLHIALYLPQFKDPIEIASVIPGVVDLAALFPRLWKNDKPELLRAQLRVGSTSLGPPLVLQPMTAPARATPADPTGVRQRFAPGTPAYFGGLRVYVDKRVLMTTTLGEMEIALKPEAAPNTAWNFRHLVEGGFYNGLTFHRLIVGDTPENGYVAQAGDPMGTGEGGPGYSIPLESSNLPHDVGVVSMARLTAPDTAGSQFFICLSRARCAALDGGYAAFGRVVRGIEVVRAMAGAAVDPRDKPIKPIVIQRARLIDAPPMGVDIDVPVTEKKPAPEPAPER